MGGRGGNLDIASTQTRRRSLNENKGKTLLYSKQEFVDEHKESLDGLEWENQKSREENLEDFRDWESSREFEPFGKFLDNPCGENLIELLENLDLPPVYKSVLKTIYGDLISPDYFDRDEVYRVLEESSFFKNLSQYAQDNLREDVVDANYCAVLLELKNQLSGDQEAIDLIDRHLLENADILKDRKYPLNDRGLLLFLASKLVQEERADDLDREVEAIKTKLSEAGFNTDIPLACVPVGMLSLALGQAAAGSWCPPGHLLIGIPLQARWFTDEPLPDDTKYTIAHELIHASQRASYDLDKSETDYLDGGLETVKYILLEGSDEALVEKHMPKEAETGLKKYNQQDDSLYQTEYYGEAFSYARAREVSSKLAKAMGVSEFDFAHTHPEDIIKQALPHFGKTEKDGRELASLIQYLASNADADIDESLRLFSGPRKGRLFAHLCCGIRFSYASRDETCPQCYKRAEKLEVY